MTMPGRAAPLNLEEALEQGAYETDCDALRRQAKELRRQANVAQFHAQIAQKEATLDFKESLPRLEDFPFPKRVQPKGPGWSVLMVELADHIGAHATLQLGEAYGGRQIYVPATKELSPFRRVIGDELAEVLSHVFAFETLPIPNMKNAIMRAKRSLVVAMIRAGKLTVTNGAIIVGTPRRYLSEIVNQTDEGLDCEVIDLPTPRGHKLLQIAADIAEDALIKASAPAHIIAAVRSEITDLCR